MTDTRHAPRVCVGIRSHCFGRAERDLYAALRECFGAEDIFIVLDETEQHVAIPSGFNKVAFDRAALDARALFADHPRNGWLCGDYFYYALRAAVAADFYWLIEPDVRFTHVRVGSFFELFAQDPTAVLLCRFGERQRNWDWHAHALAIAEQVYGCAFPVSRLGAAAIDGLLRERQQLSTRFGANGLKAAVYPNDESFVATAAMKLGLSCADLCAGQPTAFEHFSVRFPYLWPDAATEIPAGCVVHPALYAEDFEQSFSRKLGAVLNGAGELRRLARHATCGTDAAHTARVQALLEQGIGTWFAHNYAKTKKGTDLFTKKINLSPFMARHEICARAKAPLALASPGDFELAPGEPITPAEIDITHYAPYCFDYERGEFLLVDTSRAALDEPFLYQAQFRLASTVLRVPLAQMRTLTARADAASVAKPLLVFSIGRCGSTLFSRLGAVAGLVSYSEPDIFSGVGRQREDPRTADILQCAMDALIAHAGVPAGQVCIKLRSGTNGAIARFIEAFPQARYVFLSRNLRDWSHSFIAKFGWSREQLHNSLLAAHRALTALEVARIPYLALRYEDFAPEPELAFAVLTGAAEVPGPMRAELAAAVSQDAQQGSRFAGKAAEKPDIAARVGAFVETWNASAPPAARARFSTDPQARCTIREFVFIHINKTGGSSVERALGLPLEHRTALEKIREIGRRNWDRRFTFAVVRNPWDKVASHYHYRVATNQGGLGEATPGFRDWVRLAYAEHDPRYYDAPRMFMPQLRWISDQGGNILVNQVCRFEALEPDFAAVCLHLGRRVELPHAKASARPAGSWRELYDAPTRDIVAQCFREDIARFDYRF